MTNYWSSTSCLTNWNWSYCWNCCWNSTTNCLMRSCWTNCCRLADHRRKNPDRRGRRCQKNRPYNFLPDKAPACHLKAPGFRFRPASQDHRWNSTNLSWNWKKNWNCWMTNYWSLTRNCPKKNCSRRRNLSRNCLMMSCWNLMMSCLTSWNPTHLRPELRLL